MIEEPTEIFPKPIQKPHPPFYMAAVSPASYEYAAKLGISLLRSPQFTNLGTVSEAFDGYRKMMSDQGFDADAMDQPFSVRTFVAPLTRRQRPRPSMWSGSTTCWLRFCPELPAGQHRQRVVTEMKRYMHEAGATSFLHQMRIGGLEHKKVMRSMELYAKHVMPELRAEEVKMKDTVAA